jgi:hypothetical protein
MVVACRKAVVGREALLSDGERHPVTVVARFAAGVDLHGVVGRGVFEGLDQQVSERLAQPRLVTQQLKRRRGLNLDGDVMGLQ